MLDIAAMTDAVTAEDAEMMRAVALGKTIARIELAWLGVMVATELEADVLKLSLISRMTSDCE